jgi:hypothetical protein
VSELLQAWTDGDRSVLDRLTPIVYDELHRLARRYMKGERPGHSLQTTALVNEAYMRLVDYTGMQWQNRAHFFVGFGSGHEAHSGGSRPAPQFETWRRGTTRLAGSYGHRGRRPGCGFNCTRRRYE